MIVFVFVIDNSKFPSKALLPCPTVSLNVIMIQAHFSTASAKKNPEPSKSPIITSYENRQTPRAVDTHQSAITVDQQQESSGRSDQTRSATKTTIITVSLSSTSARLDQPLRSEQSGSREHARTSGSPPVSRYGLRAARHIVKAPTAARR